MNRCISGPILTTLFSSSPGSFPGCCETWTPRPGPVRSKLCAPAWSTIIRIEAFYTSRRLGSSRHAGVDQQEDLTAQTGAVGTSAAPPTCPAEPPGAHSRDARTPPAVAGPCQRPRVTGRPSPSRGWSTHRPLPAGHPGRPRVPAPPVRANPGRQGFAAVSRLSGAGPGRRSPRCRGRRAAIRSGGWWLPRVQGNCPGRTGGPGPTWPESPSTPTRTRPAPEAC
jgi:hypothetical protein